MTKDEADKEVARLKELPTEAYCPLIPAMCRKDCVCYIEASTENELGVFEASIQGRKIIGSRAQAGYCSNAMFTETEINL